jgi:hypothetical protein
MPNKPNILISDTLNYDLNNYCSEKDALSLEDETGRVKLILNKTIHNDMNS